MIKAIEWFRRPDSSSNFVTLEVVFKEVITSRLMVDFTDEVLKLVAAKFMEEHAPEILQRIQQQTTDAKVIQKVVANLRKELKEPTT